ncbi:hypothetical protein Dda_0378 [Drechslerella dactyloides]|uniref:Uncharacterized protein n=1 Tax=Drechslerella dactyloides TaxID=74499 RepID=A0AAD6NNE5_DREDA|nr:hypothetical protein Dda_0378 [Drechslerella dactyloides]
MDSRDGEGEKLYAGPDGERFSRREVVIRPSTHPGQRHIHRGQSLAPTAVLAATRATRATVNRIATHPASNRNTATHPPPPASTTSRWIAPSDVLTLAPVCPVFCDPTVPKACLAADISRMSMDPETSSIRSMRSTAPSYVSQVPSYHAHASAISEPPPYSLDGRLPPYTRQLSGRPPNSNVLQNTGPSLLRVPSGSPSSRLPNVPPVSLITPGVRSPQSRQYEAVAARRQARIVSSAVESWDPPRQQAKKRRGSRLTFDTFSSLHPAPSTPRALVHSTAELFLCTCGRPNHGRVPGDEWADAGYARQRHAHDLGLEEPFGVHKPLDEQNDASGATTCVDIAPGSDAPEKAEENNPEDQKSFEEDLLDAESKSWDFMLSQMAN